MWKKIKYTGIWLQPIVMAFLVINIREIPLLYKKAVPAYGLSFLISWLPTLYVWLWNRRDKGYGKKQFNFLDPFENRPDPSYAVADKSKAMYPDIPPQLLSDLPQGFVLGRNAGKYICRGIDEDTHIMILGNSGSGKTSSLIIPILLSNPDVPVFAIDIKGELSYKTCYYGDPKRLIISFSDRSQYGYDPFYLLSEGCSDQDILETMQTITYSLIPLPADIKDPFWKQSARNMLIGLLVYYYKSGKQSLVDVVDAILSEPVKDTIKKVCVPSNGGTIAYRYLIAFKGLEDVTLSGIFTELSNHIQIFVNDQDVRFAFKENIHKVHPLLLEQNFSIYVAIKEEKLSAYYDVMQLLVNQVLAQLEKRPEGSHKVMVIIDELGRIVSEGKLQYLENTIKVGRSRGISLVLCTQTVESLKISYSSEATADLLSNCNCIAVLNAASLETQKMVTEWCGKYKSKKKSWDGSGSNRKTSISYEDKDIIEGSDLMTLAQSGELILITPFGYCRVEKASYYNDKVLAPLAEKIKKHNDVIKNVKKEG